MATPQLSPGVLVREVDLTVGRADNVLDNIGAICGPFEIGPVEEVTNIPNEQDLINVFGEPKSADRQYEYWMSASSYLSYGGVLKVVRADDDDLKNANAGVGLANTTTLKIKNYDDYSNNYDTATDFYWAAKNPGSWAENLKVCYIDDFADQTLGITTSNLSNLGIQVGLGITASLTGQTIANATNGTTSTFNGYLKGIITGINTDATSENSTIDVKITSRVSASTTEFNTTLDTNATATAGVGTDIILVDSVSGLSTLDTLSAPGLNNLTIASVGSTSVSLASTISSAITSGIAVTFSRLVTVGGTETRIDYAEGSSTASFDTSDTINIMTSGGAVASSQNVATAVDWYDQQTLGLTNSVIYWKTLAPKPGTSVYVDDRQGHGDQLHIVVVDDTGDVTGIKGNILEKHVDLSKASDAVSNVNAPQKIYFKDYLRDLSANIYAGKDPLAAHDAHHGTTPVATGFTAYTGVKAASFTADTGASNQSGTIAQDKQFLSIGNKTYNLTGGNDYQTAGGDGYKADLGKLITGYGLFSNKDEVEVDFLIMGPGCDTEAKSQAKANYVISLAESRKDCMATVGAHRENLVASAGGGLLTAEQQTTNLINYFGPLSSSSYATFDSGYKYTFDRFNNKFVYIPTNADVAGMMARTALLAFPWFSPAGQQRGVLNNAVKLAYNPSKAQRDRLYPKRINSFITSPGAGTFLFGDKTALGYQSAFDRINVRRLFLTIEQALERAAQAQLFELNDDLTRANFRNIVDPYLRDVQAKRGLIDYLVICDSTNNTPDVIDNNEFRADIFLKPAKSINFITLTFVATRTGVSFSEVAGRV